MNFDSANNNDGPINSMSRLRAMTSALRELAAVPPARAAKELGVTPRTIYRWLEQGDLERVPARHDAGARQPGATGGPAQRGRAAWVSVRSIIRRMEDLYGPTAAFNAFASFSGTSATRPSDNSDIH